MGSRVSERFRETEFIYVINAQCNQFGAFRFVLTFLYFSCLCAVMI